MGMIALVKRKASRVKDRHGSFWRDEEGVTTVGMAVSILVSLALVFTAAQTYRVDSASAEIQEVADVAALAAENEIAEFMIAVRVCDATSLSLALLGITVYGLGIAALCTPMTAGLSAQLIEFGSKIMEARGKFAEKAASGLGALQKALPFLAAANAAAVASANDENQTDASYFAAAVLVPSSGADVTSGDTGNAADDLQRSLDDQADDIRRKAAEAEEAAKEASEAKKRGFERDCGDNPAYCMYERASKLANLSDASNPLYQSVDAWSFSVALSRAQAYYAARYAQEAPTSSSAEEQADSALRKRFYAWASEQLATGYVNETDETFSASFPHLYRNTSEMRATTLYDEAVYPITSGDAGMTMHAFDGCPEAAGFTARGSIRDLEAGSFVTCQSCKFTASSLGKVPAASTSIDNGFEYHYAAVAQAAEDYQQARATLDSKTGEVKNQAGSLFDKCASLTVDLVADRISATPPGYKGAVAIVVNTGETATDTGFVSSFVSGDNTLGARAAVSGSTLVEDEAHDGSSVITSLLDGFGQDAGAAVGAARIVLSCWSGLLSVYAQGQGALTGALESALDWLPLTSESGLGSWASGALTKFVTSVGLQPADVDALKPVLVNTAHVTEADGGSFSVSFRSVQKQALEMSSSSTEVLSSLADYVDSGAQGLLDNVKGGFEIATVEFPIGDVSFPITLTLPSAITDSASGLLEKCISALKTLSGTISGIKEWS